MGQQRQQHAKDVNAMKSEPVESAQPQRVRCPECDTDTLFHKNGALCPNAGYPVASQPTQPLTCEQQAQKSQDYPFEFGPIAQPTQPEHFPAEFVSRSSGVAEGTPADLTVTIARELYDRFVMGGWGPADAYGQIDAWLAALRGEIAQSQEELRKAKAEMVRLQKEVLRLTSIGNEQNSNQEGRK